LTKQIQHLVSAAAVYQGKIPLGVSTLAELEQYEADWASRIRVPDSMPASAVVGIARILRDEMEVSRFSANEAAIAVVSYLQSVGLVGIENR
jgi:hypothetical protein